MNRNIRGNLNNIAHREHRSCHSDAASNNMQLHIISVKSYVDPVMAWYDIVLNIPAQVSE